MWHSLQKTKKKYFIIVRRIDVNEGRLVECIHYFEHINYLFIFQLVFFLIKQNKGVISSKHYIKKLAKVGQI